MFPHRDIKLISEAHSQREAARARAGGRGIMKLAVR